MKPNAALKATHYNDQEHIFFNNQVRQVVIAITWRH